MREQLINEYKVFLDQCIWLRQCYNIYKNLYETNEKTQELLVDFAGWFFSDINRMIIEYILLQVCKITDPPKTGENDNLTAAYINQQLILADIGGEKLEKIETYSSVLHSYREKIVQGRNKVISHSDKEVALSGKAGGAHASEDVDLFFEKLFAYTDAVANAIEVEPLDYRAITGEWDPINPVRGDVIDLLTNIREWDRLRRET